MRDTDVTRKDIPPTLTNKTPIGRKLLGQLQTIYRNNPIKFRKVLLPDGTTYIVSDYHGRKEIKIIGGVREETCTVTLDTGIYNVPPNLLYAGAVPPIIEYNSVFVSTEVDRLWFGPINIVTYIENNIETYDVSFPEELYINSGEQIDVTTEFGDPPSLDDITIFNNILYKWPASCWTGLTRLFIQSIYGAHRSDLSANRTGLNSWDIGNVTLNEFMLTYDFNIFRDDETLTYWAVVIRNTSIQIYNLDLSICGETLLAWYKLNEDEISDEEIIKIEAYIFSGATIGDIKTTINFDAGAIGSPWYYGWKSNKNGSKFAVVTITQDTDTYRYTGTLSEIELTYDENAIGETPETEPEYFSVDVLQNRAEQFFLLAGHDRVFIPDIYGGGMSMIVPHPLHQGSFIASSNAPVYCFYENNLADKLKVIPFRASASEAIQARVGLSEPVGVYVCYDDLLSDNSYGAHSTQTRGFDEVINTSKTSHNTSRWWFTVENRCSANRSNCQTGWAGLTVGDCPLNTSYQNCGVDPPLPADNILPTTSLKERGDGGTWYWNRATQSDLRNSIQTMMVIPWNDAAAVYVMGYNHEVTGNSTQTERHIHSAYRSDLYYGSWTQCNWPADCPLTPFSFYNPSACFPSLEPDQMWDCNAMYGYTYPHECRCRPPGPCGGDGAPVYAQPQATRIDLMTAPSTSQDEPTDHTTYLSLMYNTKGRYVVDNDWHTLWNAPVYANPFVSMPIRARTSANKGLVVYNESQTTIKDADYYSNSAYKFFIGWQ